MVGSVFAIPRRSSNATSRAASTGSHWFAPRDRALTSLSDFIAGPENALTGLAVACVTDQWARFNPLFISGPSGIGKTHLLRCLLEAAQIVYADLRSLLITGADYARAIANALDVDSLDDVRSAHRSVDLFLLDGVHEIATKPHAQQELLHTIDSLLQQDAQILVASRLSYDETNLSAALASRLSSGLHIPLVPPAPATRRSILEELAQQSQVAIPSQVSRRLTSDSNRPRSRPLLVNDLAAAIAQLRCGSESPANASVDTADPIESSTTLGCAVTAKEINKRVARYFNVTVRELTGNSRKKTLVRARALSVYLIREMVGSSFQVIGRDVGGRDHSTVIHAFQRAAEWLDNDPGFARAAAEVGATLE